MDAGHFCEIDKIDKFDENLSINLIREVKKYKSLWKTSKMETEEERMNVIEVTKALRTKFSKNYNPHDVLERWTELKQQYFWEYVPNGFNSRVLEEMKFLTEANESRKVMVKEEPLWFDEDIAAPPTPDHLPSIIEPGFLNKLPEPAPNPNVILALDDVFDPPNDNEIIYAGTFTAPQIPYQRYPPMPFFEQPSHFYPMHFPPMMPHYPPFYPPPPIISQKRRRQTSKKSKPIDPPFWQPFHPPPFLMPYPNPPPHWPFFAPLIPSFDDFDPEKVAQQMFKQKVPLQ